MLKVEWLANWLLDRGKKQFYGKEGWTEVSPDCHHFTCEAEVFVVLRTPKSAVQLKWTRDMEPEDFIILLEALLEKHDRSQSMFAMFFNEKGKIRDEAYMPGYDQDSSPHDYDKVFQMVATEPGKNGRRLISPVVHAAGVSHSVSDRKRFYEQAIAHGLVNPVITLQDLLVVKQKPVNTKKYT